MSIPARVEAAAKGLVLWAGVGVAALTTAMAGLGFLIAGFFLWMAHYTARDAAAAITGAVLLVLAILAAVTGRVALRRLKKRQPPLLAEFTGILGTTGRIAALLIRRDPKKAMILAVIAGALAEYVTTGDKRRG